MRLALAGTHSASMNKIAAQVAGATADQLRKMRGQIPPASQADIIRDQLLNVKGALSWPDNNAVVNHLSQKPLGESRSHPVITAIAEYLQGPNSDAAIHSDATLEHIMPRSWRSHWPLPDHPNAEHSRRDAINTLGNLTLIRTDTNLLISDRMPADYLPETDDRDSNLLTTHYIPRDRELWKIEITRHSCRKATI